MDSHNLHTGARHPDELRRAAKDRGRQLRRRRTVAVRAVMALTVVAGAGVVVALVAFGPRSSVPAVTPTSRPASTAGPATKPTVDTAAFAGEGRLAFVCGGELYVLDGTTGALVRVTDGSALPSSPAFSPDGRWLAFVRPAPGSGDGPETLWLAHGDGTGAHAVAGLPSADPPPDSGTPVFSWSPTADQLVVTTGPTAAGTGSVPSAVWIVSGSGAAHRLLGPGATNGAVWAPDGSRVAVLWSTDGHDDAGVLETLAPSGGQPTVWLPSGGSTYYLAGWSSSAGILVWDDRGNGGPSVENYGLPLDALARPGASLTALATTPVFQSPALAVGAQGAVAVVGNADDSSGGGEGAKFFWFGKTVERCSSPPAGSCSAVLDQSSTVTLDPALSPVDGSLAFVAAPQSTQGLPPDYAPSQTWAAMAPWYASHSLWVVPGGGGTATQIAGTAGASDPVWSSTTGALVYEADDGLWLLASARAAPVRIASPVTPAGSSSGGFLFGYADWSDQFAFTGSDTGTSPQSVVGAVRVAFDGDGIGSARFGQPQTQAVDDLTENFGRPSASRPTPADACTIDAELSWPGGVTAYFEHGLFVGYAGGSLLALPGHRVVAGNATAAGLRVDDTVATARRLYGTAFTTSSAQGGSWSVSTPTGALHGLLTDVVGGPGPAPRIADITAGSVGCRAATP